MHSGPVLTLRALDTDVSHGFPKYVDAPMNFPRQGDNQPTLDVSIHPRVDLPSLGCKVYIQEIQHDVYLLSNQTTHQVEEGVKLNPTIQAVIQVFFSFSFYAIIRNFSWAPLCIG